MTSTTEDELIVEMDTIEPEGLLLATPIADGEPLSPDRVYRRTPDGIWLRIEDGEGPGGGWPVVAIRGPSAAVRRYIAEEWGVQAADDLEAEGVL